MIKNKKKIALLIPLVLLLSACGRSDVTESSTGFWEKGIIYSFIKIIEWLSALFGNNYGMGIIIFTVIVSILLLPLMKFQFKTTRETAELQPEVEKIKAKYPMSDRESQLKIQEETRALYKEKGVNQFAGCLPLVIQMPILIALYHAVSRSPVLRSGSFLWMDLGDPDPYFVLPVLAGIFTFLTSWLSMKAQPVQNGMTKGMTFFMPVMIIVMAVPLASAVSLYWVARNVFSVGQTLLLNNPYKLQREREEKKRLEKKRERDLKKAWHSKKK